MSQEGWIPFTFLHGIITKLREQENMQPPKRNPARWTHHEIDLEDRGISFTFTIKEGELRDDWEDCLDNYAYFGVSVYEDDYEFSNFVMDGNDMPEEMIPAFIGSFQSLRRTGRQNLIDECLDILQARSESDRDPEH